MISKKLSAKKKLILQGTKNVCKKTKKKYISQFIDASIKFRTLH